MLHFLASTTWQPWPPISRSASKHTSFPKLQCIQSPEKKLFLKPRKKLRSLPSQFHLGKRGWREKEKWFFFVFLAGFFFREKENLSFRQLRKRRRGRTQTTPLLLLSCFPYIFSDSSLPPPSRRDGSEIYIFADLGPYLLRSCWGGGGG